MGYRKKAKELVESMAPLIKEYRSLKDWWQGENLRYQEERRKKYEKSLKRDR